MVWSLDLGGLVASTAATTWIARGTHNSETKPPRPTNYLRRGVAATRLVTAQARAIYDGRCLWKISDARIETSPGTFMHYLWGRAVGVDGEEPTIDKHGRLVDLTAEFIERPPDLYTHKHMHMAIICGCNISDPRMPKGSVHFKHGPGICIEDDPEDPDRLTSRQKTLLLYRALHTVFCDLSIELPLHMIQVGRGVEIDRSASTSLNQGASVRQA